MILGQHININFFINFIFNKNKKIQSLTVTVGVTEREIESKVSNVDLNISRDNSMFSFSLDFVITAKLLRRWKLKLTRRYFTF